MKKQKPGIKPRPKGWKNEMFKKKAQPGKSHSGKQGSIRSGAGKRY